MKKKLNLFMPLIMLLIMNACSTTKGPNENTGMVIGGLLGGALGHQIGDGRGQTIATVIGAVMGTAIGGNVGRSMDDSDQLKVSHSLETVRTGVPTVWINPDTNNRYQVKPLKTYYYDRSPCREYQIKAEVGGKMESIYGKACRQADGSWQVVSDE
jgi:surface antigen